MLNRLPRRAVLGGEGIYSVLMVCHGTLYRKGEGERKQR